MTSSPFFPVGLRINTQEDDSFYAVVDRLKTQNALPEHCFLKDVPFFNMPSISKETQIREHFEHSCDVELCKELLKNVVPLSKGTELKVVPQNFSSVSVMTFAQIILYKVLPCPEENCVNCPREIATHNQYKDFEYTCPFYHHEKDQRRFVISDSVDEEFMYKANYFEEGRRRGDKDKYSQNYFESMFHPLYYKMFRCKRDFCNQSPFCPFYHSESEKKLWDDTFSGYINKDRVSYVKEKQQKTFEKKSAGLDYRRRNSDEEEPQQLHSAGISGYVDRRAHIRQRPNTKKKTLPQQPQQQFSPTYFEEKLDKKWDWKVDNKLTRKDSNDSSFEEKYGRGFFNKLQENIEFNMF